MKLIINTATTHKGGGVQVARSFIGQCKNHPQYTYHIILGISLREKLSKEKFPNNFHFYEIPYRPATRIFFFRSPAVYFKKLEKKIQPDVVFTTSGPSYWRPSVPHISGYNLPHYIYNDSSFFQIIRVWQKFKWKLKGHLIRYFFKRDADAFVVQTEDVNQRLQKWLNTSKPIYTVSNTYSRYFHNPKKYRNKLPGKKESEFRLLLLSAHYLHKNFEIIPQIIDVLPQKMKKQISFVLTIENERMEQLFSPKHKENIINVGPVPIEEAPSLYMECDAMFLPTLLECFSASYPEAMTMEKPIITTDLGFAHSICGEAALYYSALDAKDAAEKITELVNNPTLQQDLIEKGKERMKSFPSPEERAREYLRICEEMVQNGQ